MIILALDTTAATATAALTDNDKLIGLYMLNVNLTHSEIMLPMIENLLKNSKIDINDVDIFACSAGPGSFTGVRIGISLLKGLAFGKERPCVAVSSLQALAYNLNGFDGIICPVMDARRNQIYNALFYRGERLCEDRLTTLNDLKNEIKQYGHKIYYVGDGYKLIDFNMTETPEMLRYQNAYSVASCAFAIYANAMENNNRQFIYTDKTIAPVYLRASQAERELNIKHGM